MLQFHEITLSDKPAVDRCAALANDRFCEHCFADIFIWQGNYNTDIAFWEDFCFLRMLRAEGPAVYLAPFGGGDYLAALALVEKDAAQNGRACRLISVTPAQKELMEKEQPGRFVFSTSEDTYDYIYLSEKLRTLSGSKLQTKRNLANRFEAAWEGRWTYSDMTAADRDEVYAFHLQWGKDNPQICRGDFEGETCAVVRALNHFEALGMKGGILRVDGAIAAFTLGTPYTADTFVVQIEKADHRLDGAYQIINREFVRHNCADFTYVNREEDLGIPGLRQAKRGYRPVMMGEKYRADPAE